jgi:hypothetical protein
MPTVLIGLYRPCGPHDQVLTSCTTLGIAGGAADTRQSAAARRVCRTTGALGVDGAVLAKLDHIDLEEDLGLKFTGLTQNLGQL